MANGQEVARLYVSVGADLSDLEKGLSRAKGELDKFAATAGAAASGGGVKRLEEGAKSASRGFGQMADSMALSAGKAALYGASFGLALGAVNTLTSAIGGLISSGLSMNARLETSKIQFQNLGLSGEAAKSHIADLFKLGAETPFETQPLIDASRMLRVFGGDALDTMANLRLFGDTSAATGADLGALTFWVGRLYADLQQGKPIGEAEQNLRQLAVLSPEAAQKMDQLKASGASASAIFAAFTGSLGHFNGAMETQAHTMSGLTSTFTDLTGQLAATALAPVFEANKAALEGINKTLASPEAQHGAEGIAGGLRTIGDAIGGIGAHWNDLPEPVKRLLAGSVAGPVGAALNVSAQPVGNVISQLQNLGSTAFAAEAPVDLLATALQSNARAALQVATPGGFDIAASERNQNPGLLASSPPTFTAALNVAAMRRKEDAARQADTFEAAFLQGQALAAQADGGDMFNRHAGPGTDLAKAIGGDPAEALAFAERQFSQGIGLRQAGVAAAGLAEQRAAFGRAQEQVGIQRQIQDLQTKSALDTAFGDRGLGRAEEFKAAELQDHLRYVQELVTNTAALTAAQQSQSAAQIELATAEHAQDAAGVAMANARIAGYGALIDQIKAAGGAIREETTAQDALNVRTLEQNFGRSQAAARAGVSNLALYEDIAGMKTPAKDKADQERELQGVERERMLQQIDLAAAQRDGDTKAVDRIKERISLLDAEKTRIEALGIAHKAGGGGGGSGAPTTFEGWRWALANRVEDPYHLYGGGAINPETNLPALPPKPKVDTTPSQDTHIAGDVIIQVQNATEPEVLGALRDAIKRRRGAMPALAPA